MGPACPMLGGGAEEASHLVSVGCREMRLWQLTCTRDQAVSKGGAEAGLGSRPAWWASGRAAGGAPRETACGRRAGCQTGCRAGLVLSLSHPLAARLGLPAPGPAHGESFLRGGHLSLPLSSWLFRFLDSTPVHTASLPTTIGAAWLPPRRLRDQDGGCEHCGPITLLVADGRLCDVGRLEDLLADLPDLLFLDPRFFRVELDAEDGGQHRGGQVLGVLPRGLVVLSVGMMFRQVAVRIPVRGDGDADRGGDQPMRLVGRGLADDDVGDLPGLEVSHALALGNDAAAGREDARDADDVQGRDVRLAQGHLEGGQLLLVLADSLGEEDLRGDVHPACSPLPAWAIDPSYRPMML